VISNLIVFLYAPEGLSVGKPAVGELTSGLEILILSLGCQKDPGGYLVTSAMTTKAAEFAK
jgi:hypothetical protein